MRNPGLSRFLIFFFFVHFVKISRNILEMNVYTHLCLSLWTLGDSSLHTVFFPADTVKYLPQKSEIEKHCIFYLNKMFFYDVYCDFSCPHIMVSLLLIRFFFPA